MSKPVLYVFGLSVWAAAPQLAIVELGYAPDAIKQKVVNLAEGANFTPGFLKLNPNATLPTFTSVDGKNFTNTYDVIKYLAQHAPKKVAPGDKAFLDRIHEDSIDPNFIIFAVRNEEELKAASSGFPHTFLENRQSSLIKNSQTPEAAPFKAFYDAKIPVNGGLLDLFSGKASESDKKAFFELSAKHWENISNFIVNELPTVLPDSGFIGGEIPGEADFHLGAWLARVAHILGGKNAQGEYKVFEKETKVPVPTKVAAYFDAWVTRPSWQQVYAEGLH
ncbi:hypothetical protein C8Q75DRAFT_731156 [Abortiporus biennis]|nr:hypothetical protein C8Q75DRAFT_731156 [Abortiporus biennis]